MFLFYVKILAMRSLEEVLVDLKEAEKEFAEKIMEFELKQKAFDEANLQNDKQEKENH